MIEKNLEGKTAPADTSSAREHYIAAIPGVFRWTALGFKNWYDIIVTDRRFIFSFLKSQCSDAVDYSKRNIDEIAGENKKNISIEISTLKSFKYVPGQTIDELCGKHHEVDGQVQVKTPESKYTFYIPYRLDRVTRGILKTIGLDTGERAPEVFRGI